jgi:hypothetical protein
MKRPRENHPAQTCQILQKAAWGDEDNFSASAQSVSGLAGNQKQYGCRAKNARRRRKFGSRGLLSGTSP